MTNSPMPITAPMFRPQAEAAKPYDRALYSRLAARTGMTIYRRQHIQKLVQMVAKVVGANPHGLAAAAKQAAAAAAVLPLGRSDPLFAMAERKLPPRLGGR